MKWLAYLLLISFPYSASSQGTIHSYFTKHSQVIDLKAKPHKSGLRLMDSVVPEYKFFFTAEEHGKAINSQLQFRILTYLHQKAGVRNVLLEGGYSYAHLINRYLETGEEELLDWVMDQIPICAAEQRDLFKKIRAYNLRLDQRDRIGIYGVDLEFSPSLSIYHLNSILPEKKPSEEIKDKLKELTFLNQTLPREKSKTKRFFRKLNRDLKKKETAYSDYFGAQFDLFAMIVRNTHQAYRFTPLKSWLFEQTWRKREERMYENFLLIKDSLKSGNFHAQFGVWHTDIKSSPRWKFPTFAHRLNNFPSSPVQGKVLSISQHVERISPSYTMSVEYKILEEMKHLAKKMFANRIVLLSMIEEKSPFEELSKIFQFIIFMDQELELIDCK